MELDTSELNLTEPPVVTTGMLIRRPVPVVYEAFADPKVTSNFWFTNGSGRLEQGREVVWEWEMYGVSTTVTVKDLVPNERIVIEWEGQNGPTTVEWIFTAHGDEATYVGIRNWGFEGTDDEVVGEALDSMQGFTMVLAGAKAFLEHGIDLGLVADRAPRADD